MTAFAPFPKIPRADKVTCWITEKIDGTNAQILIGGECGQTTIQAGSRNRWIHATDNAKDDNFGFARWVHENQELLMRLGPGRHFGEWYGEGIGRRYGMSTKKWALFDRRQWSPEELTTRGLDAVGVQCVPLLATCSIANLASTLAWVDSKLATEGSVMVPGWGAPEGYVVELPEGIRFKVTDNGNRPKWQDGIHNPEQYKPGVLNAVPINIS